MQREEFRAEERQKVGPKSSFVSGPSFALHARQTSVGAKFGPRPQKTIINPTIITAVVERLVLLLRA